MNNKTKQERCRFCHMQMGKSHNETHCVVDGWEDDKVRNVTLDECEKCSRFDSKFIEYPVEINGIENKKIEIVEMYSTGSLCRIQPCKEEYKGKTYLGIYLGELPTSICSTINRETKVLKNIAMTNPAIYVPDIKKIIFGYESWWEIIESADELKEITEEDINNI